MENVWNTWTVPKKPRWIAVSYIYLRKSGVGVVAFSLVIKCLLNLFMLQSYKWWIFHINERSPQSPLECRDLFLYFTIGEWGKIGQRVSFFKMAGTDIWPIVAIIQMPMLLTLVGHKFSYIISSGDFFHFDLIWPDLKINMHRKSEIAPLWRWCGIWS